MWSIGNFFYDVDRDEVYSRADLYKEFLELRKSDPENYGDYKSFGQYLNDCTGKNGSLDPLDYHLGSIFDDLQNVGFDLDYLGGTIVYLQELRDKICKDADEQYDFEQVLKKYFNDMGW